MSVEEANGVVAELANINSSSSNRSKVKVMTAFSRRFDDSYRNAVRAIRAGRIGTPVVVRSETRDMYDPSPFYHAYMMANPGIFIDTAVHDVDLTLALLGAGSNNDNDNDDNSQEEDKLRPQSAHAIGTIAKHTALATTNDVDNATDCVAWYPPRTGAPASLLYYFCSRTMAHGFDNPTEIMGTEGVLKVNLHPRRDLVTVGDRDGLRNDVMPDFYERYDRAFVTELAVFADAVLPYPLETAVKGMEIADG